MHQSKSLSPDEGLSENLKISISLYHNYLKYCGQFRTSPVSTGKEQSPAAGATYPLEVFASVGKQTVEGLKAGIYHYEIDTHSLSLHLRDDMRQKLAEAALSQSFIATASVNIVICALFSRTSYRYGKRGERYVHMEETEAGHAGQKISLQAIALGMATILIGAFDDEEIRKVLEIEGQIEPLYIIPIGKPL